MALINLIAKSKKEINWGHFFGQYSALNHLYIEVFPIPKELGFNADCVGISVPKGYNNRKAVISELEQIVEFGITEPYSLTFTELYDGVEISQTNASAFFDKFLPV
ncbi:hypothetical protein AAFN85_02415 [Mucilaginibacter sp. CAU 1740]|uniref:hypothetical protein n=1 Tax=Mucilaginibacter sp. CAU 1740 TaxID=3140365 RepID=UPI00325B503F